MCVKERNWAISISGSLRFSRPWSTSPIHIALIATLYDSSLGPVLLSVHFEVSMYRTVKIPV
jgi:hypothetical protein